MTQIDLNCDLGEGSGCDEQLMALISSANIACGGHAGEESTMRAAVRLAMHHGVSIGAHPGYPDREGFGRVEMNLLPAQVVELVQSQVRALVRIAKEEGASVHHVKPHGALYNTAAKKHEVAEAICQAVAQVDDRLMLVGLSGSQFIEIARSQGLRVVRECFADRTYRDDGTLTPRSDDNSVIESEDEAVAQAVRIVMEKCVISTTGRRIPMLADTLCVHGDGIRAVQVLQAVRRGLIEKHVVFRPCEG